MKSKVFSPILAIIFSVSSIQADLPELDFEFEGATASTQGDNLIVSTGQFERIWKWTGKGLVTTSAINLKTDRNWAERTPAYSSDWEYSGVINDTDGELIRLEAKSGDDEGFTSDFLEVVAEIHYPSVETTVKYQIWAYPDSAGVLTRLWFKGSPGKYVADDAFEAQNNITFELLTGANRNPYLAKGAGMSWFSSQVIDEERVQYHLKGLEAGKDYMLGLSWWDWDNKSRTQQLQVTSVDGEARAVLIEPEEIGTEPQSHVVELPVHLAIDNTLRLYVENMGGPDARISEIWLYEKNAEHGNLKNGIVERIEAIKASAPQGYGLVSYLDSGVATQDEELIPTGRVDYIPAVVEGKQRKYFGYYNDTQHRNFAHTPVYREQIANNESEMNVVNWASAVSLESDGEGLIILKESHKCVNQYGVDTGEFVADEMGITNTGTSLYPHEITTDKYRWAWASWMLAFEGGDDEREYAIKSFDRTRFPVNLERDMYIMTLTWGHSIDPRHGMDYAWESSVLRAMPLAREMGIDLVLIDSGWQMGKDTNDQSPVNNLWRPNTEVYPEGWRNVKIEKKRLDLDMGLWGIARTITLEDLKWNWDQIKMRQFKLDFASFPDHDSLDQMMSNAREFILHTNHQSKISWDLTENAPRYGYYWAREYGNLHFMNRKPDLPANVTYVPWLALRDFWMLARYNNLNKFQLTSHNPELVNPEISDAILHSPEYCVATSLFGVPQMFCMPRNYRAETRANLRAMFDVLKEHRENIWTSYVYPIGEEPSNKSYTGFQSYDDQTRSGYFLAFRELGNPNSSEKMTIRFLRGETLELEDLYNREKWTAEVNDQGLMLFEFDKPASYKFIKYTIK